ncbi:Ankyrin repeat protein 1 [Giardia muris]|uniref:Ankyrin repeat protein 1 n=1 Tax=Giardia muris TaxID=5742 RepID=A0A4Z1SUR4_GIAMU|nr:Ankyrin repeat protein 1 [Giardia muris]|eukprot:TNJ27348.1 Ankyrin repeat protein 1 [Giardia muris]
MRPLERALWKGDVEAVLLHLGDAGERDPQGMTGLMYSAIYGHMDCVKLLLKSEGGCQKDNGWTALMYAAAHDHPELIRELSPREARLSNKYGWTALMQAAYRGHLDCVRALLCELSLQTTQEWNGCPVGASALIIAAIFNRGSIVSVLMTYERDIVDAEGRDALWHALHNARDETGALIPTGHLEVINALRAQSTRQPSPVKIPPSMIQSFKRQMEGSISSVTSSNTP